LYFGHCLGVPLFSTENLRNVPLNPALAKLGANRVSHIARDYSIYFVFTLLMACVTTFSSGKLSSYMFYLKLSPDIQGQHCYGRCSWYQQKTNSDVHLLTSISCTQERVYK
jgi:hypothetical protein